MIIVLVSVNCDVHDCLRYEEDFSSADDAEAWARENGWHEIDGLWCCDLHNVNNVKDVRKSVLGHRHLQEIRHEAKKE